MGGGQAERYRGIRLSGASNSIFSRLIPAALGVPGAKGRRRRQCESVFRVQVKPECDRWCRLEAGGIPGKGGDEQHNQD